jgi:WhiB family redox-sensing transcriptional regulator
MSWRAYAACRDEDPELFFPDGVDDERVALAVAVCQRCPSSNACLEWALRTGQDAAVAGGLTPDELIARRHQRRSIGYGFSTSLSRVAASTAPALNGNG